MSVNPNDNLKLRPCIALVEGNGFYEFFNTNTRETIKIKIDYPYLTRLLLSFDGSVSIKEVWENFSELEISELMDLLGFLVEKRVVTVIDVSYPKEIIEKYPRLAGFLEDFIPNSSGVLEAINEIGSTKVCIAGLGAVGSWVSESLARSGVSNFVLIDDDIVDVSNIHRQSFLQSDIGEYKADALERRLKRLGAQTIEKHKVKIGETTPESLEIECGLFVNCADNPSVDQTSLWVGRYCMSKGIPHIIGGGYNLHLTLIGQVVIPGESSCVMCSEKYKEEEVELTFQGVKKLDRKSRKIGSFFPLTGISSAVTAIECLKVLLGKYSSLVTSDSKMEFQLYSMDFSREILNRHPNCEWCGDNGEFYKRARSANAESVGNND